MESAIKKVKLKPDILYTIKIKEKNILTKINDKGQKIVSREYTIFQKQASAFTLTNENIFFVEIIKPLSNFAQTII